MIASFLKSLLCHMHYFYSGCATGILEQCHHMSVNAKSKQPAPQRYSFRSLACGAKEALVELSPFERALHIFWLFGPFILLIERSPADIWLTFLALAFVVRAIMRREGDFLRIFWVRAAFVFWAVCLLSAALSKDPAHALGEAAGWIRFPLFAMASAFWLGRDRRLLYAMLIATSFGLLIMCGILTAEIMIEGQKNGRLTWPYGDHVPGNYLAKVGLPAFTVMVALAVAVQGRLAALSGIFALVTMFFSLMTGERINFLIRACGGMLAGLVWRPKWRRYAALVAFEILAVVIAFQAMPEMSNRFIDSFVNQLPSAGQGSPYYRAMAPGIMAFNEAPVLGIGTGNFYHMCPEIIAGDVGLDCHPHPHNFYIQMAGETGIVGLVTGTIFLWSIIWACFSSSRSNRENVVLATSWVIPFGLFWPVASTADFFGQWNNIFMWSAVALALAATNLSRHK
jgi:O-antigen ligase